MLFDYSSLPRASIDLTPESFRSLVLSGQDHWVLDFYAPWCGPCQHFAPEFEVLARVRHWFFFCQVPACPAATNCDMKPGDVLEGDVLCVVEDLLKGFSLCNDRFLKERFVRGRWTVRLIIRPVNQLESPPTQLSDFTRTGEQGG